MVNQSTKVIRRFIEEAGTSTQSLGLGRNVGQIYAYLYFSPEPRNLGDMQDALGISKGSASMSVRQLEQWDAVRRVWIKGDRKDYWEASDWFGRILKRALFDTIAQKMSVYTDLIDNAETLLRSDGKTEERKNGKNSAVQQNLRSASARNPEPGTPNQERRTTNDEPGTRNPEPPAPSTKHQAPAEAFLLERLRLIRRFHDKARKTWENPLLQRLLK